MGEVWRATDLRLDRPVAVKVLPTPDADQELVARFRREAQLAAVLQHPGITVVHDIDEDAAANLLYLVMELLDGEDLGKLLSRRPQGMPVKEVLSYAAQISSALGAAHSRGIVHRDIKPANLIVTSTGWVKICDFGIARFVQSATGLTGSAIIGSPIFMAPEQISGGEIDARTDLYALGCLLHQMLCGQPPFPTDKGIPALINAHLNLSPTGPREVNPQVSQELDDLVLELLAKDPALRPDSAATVTQHLQALLGADTAAPAPDPKRAQLEQEHQVAAEHLGRQRPDLALPLADHVARERERYLGADHPDTLSSRHLVGVALYQLDREAEAASVISAVAQARSRVLGPHHPDTLDSWHRLATVLYGLGRYADALPIAAGVAADYEQTLGPRDPATLDSRDTLAWTLHMLDRNDEALAIAQNLAGIRSEVLGEEHEDTLDTLELISWILLARGQAAEAEQLAAQLHQGFLQQYGPAAQQTIEAQTLLDTCRTERRRRRR
jgi:hypothetical protein